MRSLRTILAASALSLATGCSNADKDKLAATRSAVNEANAVVQADPNATPKMKDAANKATQVVNAGVTESGDVDWVSTVTTAGGYLPAPYNSIVGIGAALAGAWLVKRRKAGTSTTNGN